MKSAQPNGYTVLELMIVIAVSASMFITVAIAFGGRQQQIQFTQAVRDLDARIVDTINDVSTGYYGNSGTIKCTVDATSATARPAVDGTVAAATADSQGSSDDCVFVGKAIQFAPLTSTDPGTPQPDFINIYNVIGRRKNSGATTNSLQDARPRAVAPTDASNALNLDSQVSKIPLQWGIQITDIVDNAANTYGTIGFFTTFARTFNTPTGDDITLSNNQSVKYGAIPTTSLNQSPFLTVGSINKITDNIAVPVSGDIYVDTTSNVVAAGVRPRAVTICLKSSDGRRAAIVIGADGSTTTQIQFDNYDTGKCVS